MFSSNCCFLTCIQVSQEAGQVVWYFHLFQNFPQFVVIHAVKGFRVVKGAEVDVFWNSLAFSMIQQMLAIWSLVPLPFLKPAQTSGSSRFILLMPGLENFEYYFTSVWDECNCAVVWAFFGISFLRDWNENSESKVLYRKVKGNQPVNKAHKQRTEQIDFKKSVFDGLCYTSSLENNIGIVVQ